MFGKEYEEIIVLNKKIDELIAKYYALNDEMAELKVYNKTLEEAVNDKEAIIKDLETKNERIKLTGALLGESENAVEAKKKITELSREIDKCVALLNR
jgi:predicted  nucleic acid-binding Zn-ribbon protein